MTAKNNEKLWILQHFKVGGLSSHSLLVGDRDTDIVDTHVASVYNMQAFLKSGRGFKSRRTLRY